MNYEEGDKILVQNVNDSTWGKGIVIKKLNQPRSYLVKLDKDGRVIRRNSVHLKKLKENGQFTHLKEDQGQARVPPSNSFSTARPAARCSDRKRCPLKRLDL